MSRDKDEPVVPSWDGEVSGWTDYTRRVKLCHAQTSEYKRHLLGPKLVLKLKGKAWEIAAMVDDEQLSSQSGAQYLLGFLRQRLGRLPIPDLGQHVEELFVKLRRQPGVDLVSWSNQLREAYRKLQRSLARTMTPKKTVSVQTDPMEAEPARLSHGSGSEPHREPGDGGSNAGEDPTSPVRSAGQPSIAPEEQEASPSESDHWDWRSWRGWYWRHS